MQTYDRTTAGLLVPGAVAVLLTAVAVVVSAQPQAAIAAESAPPPPPAVALAAAAAAGAPPSMLRPDAAASAVVDLRVDANRDGFVDRRAPKLSDDVAHKNDATVERGALMIPNLDDDSRRCPPVPVPPRDSTKTPDVSHHLTCNDAADEVVNGASDEADLMTVAALPMPAVTAAAVATVTIPVGASKVRLFVKHPTGWKVLPPTGAVPVELLRRGLEMGVEAKEMLLPGGWDGVARITLSVRDGATMSSDQVALRVAPALMTHHLQHPDLMWYPAPLSATGDPAQRAFAKNVEQQTLASGAGTPIAALRTHGVQYVQDITEPMTISVPRGTGMSSLRILSLRGPDFMGEEPLVNAWRGPNLSVRVITYPTAHGNLNAGGNIEVIPPYTSPSGKRWPHGRLLMGRIDMDKQVVNPASAWLNLVAAQQLQGPAFFVNTGWLGVGHVDEVVSFIPAATPRGWKMVIADPRAADKLAYTALKAGATQFSPPPRERDNLSPYYGAYQRKHVAMAIAEVDRIEKAIVQETGLTPQEIVRVPVPYEAPGKKYGDAYEGDRIATRPGMVRLGSALPNAVNSQLIGKNRILVPGQFGPRVKGRDLFMDAVNSAFRQAGLTPVMIDDREAAWAGSGDVHCSTSVWRRALPWWTTR